MPSTLHSGRARSIPKASTSRGARTSSAGSCAKPGPVRQPPHSGHWRIPPGVFTLQEYFQDTGRFEPAGDYTPPRVGDVVIYDRSSALGQHTNIVVGGRR